MIRRNVAPQTIKFPALLLSANGNAVTSGATLTIGKDGTDSASAGTLTHTANGVWQYTFTQAETNAAIVTAVLFATGAVPVVLNLVTTAADTSAAALGAGTAADVAAIKTKTDSITFTSGKVDSHVVSMATDSLSAGAVTVAAANAIAGTAIEGLATSVMGDLSEIRSKTDGITYESGIVRCHVVSMEADSITAEAAAADFIGAAEIAASASSEIADLIAQDWIAGDASPLAIAAAVRTELATELARIDETISSRMAGSNYEPPISSSDISSRIANDIFNGANFWDGAIPTFTAAVSQTLSADIINSNAGWDEANNVIGAAVATIVASSIVDANHNWELAIPALTAAISAKIAYDIETDEINWNAARNVWLQETSGLIGNDIIDGSRNWDAAKAAIATSVDAQLLNAGDATDLIASIVSRIGNTNIDQATLVVALKAALFDSGSIGNKLAVDSSGRVTISGTTGLDAAGVRAAIGMASANLDTQLGAINGPAIAAGVVASLAGVTITLDSPLFSGEDGEDLAVIQGDDYAASPVRIDIESSLDLTDYHFVIAARLQSNTATKLGLRMQIQSDSNGNYAMFAPTAEQTESWTAGTYELRHRIEYAANKYKTIKSGILSVLPFDTPTLLIDVDPPA